MLAIIKRALDTERLTKELATAEDKIESLQRELSSRTFGPDFMMVAKNFDVSHINDRVYAQVVDDFSKFLEPHMLDLLKQGSSNMQRERNYMMNVSAAQEIHSGVHQFIFEVPAMGTTVKAMMF